MPKIKWRHVVSLIVPLVAFIFGLVSLALPSWYTQDIHGEDGSITESRTYGLFVWSSNNNKGSKRYNPDNYRTQWMLACSGLMVIAVVFFGLSFIILCIYFLKKSYRGKDKNLLHASQAMSICGCLCNLVVVCAWSARLAEFETVYGTGQSRRSYWHRAEFGPGFFTSIISLIVGVVAVVEDGWPSDEDPDDVSDTLKNDPDLIKDEPEQKCSIEVPPGQSQSMKSKAQKDDQSFGAVSAATKPPNTLQVEKSSGSSQTDKSKHGESKLI